MPYGPTYFESKGRCIYCGIYADDLTDEHIVPLALGGQHVLRDASCKECAKLTSHFELKVARGLWGDARTSFDGPSRRKKKRPKTILCYNPSAPERAVTVPVSEYPAGLVFYKMGKPGFLEGVDHETDLSRHWKLIMIDDDQRRADFFKKYGFYPALQFRHVPNEFGRMIAKIGYGQVLTVLHPWEFNHIALPYILGDKTNVSFIVGSDAESITPIPTIGYSLKTEGILSKQFDRLLLLAKVRLYSNTHAPEYTVVVGEVLGKEKVTDALERLGPKDFETMPSQRL